MKTIFEIKDGVLERFHGRVESVIIPDFGKGCLNIGGQITEWGRGCNFATKDDIVVFYQDFNGIFDLWVLLD